MFPLITIQSDCIEVKQLIAGVVPSGRYVRSKSIEVCLSASRRDAMFSRGQTPPHFVGILKLREHSITTGRKFGMIMFLLRTLHPYGMKQNTSCLYATDITSLWDEPV